jgi:hypothetical protein
MNSVVTPTIGRELVFKQAGWRETVVLVAVAWMVPFLVHLLPWVSPRPLGAYLLPIFWATFVAVYFYGAWTGLITGLVAPVINTLVTGSPAGHSLAPTMLEVTAFVLVTAILVRRAPRFVLAAPLGYVAARVVSTLLVAATRIFGEVGTPVDYFTRAIVGGVAGLVVLTAINSALVGYCPKTLGESPDATAE